VASLSALARFQQIDALTTIPMIDAPKLFISSADDIPAQASHEQFWAQALDPREQEIYEGNAHGTDLLASPSGPSVEQRLIDFLSEH
jgi:hypothetical protein